MPVVRARYMNRLYAANALRYSSASSHPRMDFPLSGVREAHMGIGMSLSQTPGKQPTLDLLLYALHMAECFERSTILLADAPAVRMRVAVHGESFEEAWRKVHDESKNKIAALEALREAFNIPPNRLRIMTWSDLAQDRVFQRNLARLKRLRAVNPSFVSKLLALIPPGLKKQVAARVAREKGVERTRGLKRVWARVSNSIAYRRELLKLTDYALNEIAATLTLRGVKVGHEKERGIDALTQWAAKRLNPKISEEIGSGLQGYDWLRTGDVEHSERTGLTFVYLPPALRPESEPKEPYLYKKASVTLFVKDSIEEVRAKCRVLGKQLDHKLQSFAWVVPSLRVLTRLDEIYPAEAPGGLDFLVERLSPDVFHKHRQRQKEEAAKAWNTEEFVVRLFERVREPYLRRLEENQLIAEAVEAKPRVSARAKQGGAAKQTRPVLVSNQLALGRSAA
ncbi:MAG: hypothetical protein QW343_01840 [Candidatus Norongarragalinales archaeon]